MLFIVNFVYFWWLELIPIKSYIILSTVLLNLKSIIYEKAANDVYAVSDSRSFGSGSDGANYRDSHKFR